MIGSVSCLESYFIDQPEIHVFQLRAIAIVFTKEIIWCNARISALDFGFYEKLE